MGRIGLGLRERQDSAAAVACGARQLLLVGARAQPGFEHAQCAPRPSHWYRQGAVAPGFSGDRRLVRGGARGGPSSWVSWAQLEFPRHRSPAVPVAVERPRTCDAGTEIQVGYLVLPALAPWP